MSRYNPDRDITPAFIDRVANWIAADGEVLVVLRWVGGGRDYALCHSRTEFERLIEIVCDGTEVNAIRGHYLPIRGQVDEKLIVRAIAAIPDGADFLLLSAATNSDSRLAARVCEGDTRSDMEETLQEWTGVEVAVGICPNFWVADHEGLISRAKGGVEGPR